MSNYSPGIPTSFDPALFLDSEPSLIPDTNSPAPASSSHSDELDALQQCADIDKAQKTKKGIVIQHRAWRLEEAFRSQEDYSVDTPLRRRSPVKRYPTDSSIAFPSSPPTLNNMPLASSPITYPASSAPAQAQSPKKRKRTDEERERNPLSKVQPNKNQKKRIGGFLDESDDDEDDDFAASKEYALKRVKELHNGAALDIDTPPASQEGNAHTDDFPMDYQEEEYARSPSPVKQSTVVYEEPSVPTSAQPMQGAIARTASGKAFYIGKKRTKAPVAYEQLIASRSVAVEGRAQKSYYGLDIHSLIDEAKVLEEERLRLQQERQKAQAEEIIQPTIEHAIPQGKSKKSNRTLMWMEKYRARKFTDLVGDERTHRSVLRWLKAWDPIVFPGSMKIKAKSARKEFDNGEEQRHRKVLLLTGPPGLGKTTLAHVCARQAGYEVQEINASDERSRDVVKGRIRDMVGTENVRGVHTKTADGKVRKAGKPVCVVVDEVDGVVSGSGGAGEGGFIKALIDLINLDEKNSRFVGQTSTATTKKRKGDKFRMLRPLILVCNDVYHPSLRPLRQSSHAEIIHVRKPALNMVVSRIHDIFGREGIPADSDGVRRLCEATWGVSTKKEGGTGSGTGEGDIRGVMVVSEWVAGRLRASNSKSSEPLRLTRQWVEANIISDLGHGGGAARSLGRGGTKDVVDRVFREGAGFPKQAEATIAKREIKGVIGVAEAAKRRAMSRLREMVDTSGDSDRVVSDIFTAYPSKPYQDDTFLSKPTSAYEWLHFHDSISSQVHSGQEWELAPYLSQSVLAFHDLFASSRHQSSNPTTTDPDAEPNPFSGPGASFAAFEARKACRAQLMGLQSTLSLPLTRLFRSPEEMALELLPYVLRMLSPHVKPVIVNTGPSGSKSAASATVRKASEKAFVKKAVEAMAATGVRFERSRVETEDIANRSGGWVLRMEPPLDQLASFETLAIKRDDKVRYAVRSVLESEWKKESIRIDGEARRRRGGHVDGEDLTLAENSKEREGKRDDGTEEKVTRDFFGRVVKEKPRVEGQMEVEIRKKVLKGDEGRIWFSFREGYSNAVRKPVTLDDLMRGL